VDLLIRATGERYWPWGRLSNLKSQISNLKSIDFYLCGVNLKQRCVIVLCKLFTMYLRRSTTQV